MTVCPPQDPSPAANGRRASGESVTPDHAAADGSVCRDRMRCMEVWGGNAGVSRQVETPGLKVRVHSRPHANAAGGGDVYYLSSCASGRITRLLLADVSGHGAGVAGLAVSLRDLMRRHVNLIDQTRFVREMNRQFSAALETDRFATAVVCTYFSPRRSLQICCAGHPPPLIYRQAKGAWAYAGDSGADADGPVDLPLGVLPTADYTRLETTLNRGDLLLCYSDAFTESVDAVGAPLGAAGLLEAVAQTDATRPHTVAPTLIERLKQADPQNLDQDDATVILVQAVDSTPSLGDSLLAPVRLLGTARDRTDVR